MATLTIRNLPDKIRERLRVRAAKRGVSMEAEARAILTEAINQRTARGRHASVGELQDWIEARRKKARSFKNDSATLIRDRRRETILEVIREGRQPAGVFGSDYGRILSEAGWTESYVRTLERQAT